MDPGRKIEFQACDPWIWSGRPFSAVSMRSRTGGLVSMVLATRGRSPRPYSGSSAQAHAVAVAVRVGALVGIAPGGGVAHLAEDDDTGRAPVDAEGAAGADVVVDREDHVVGRVDTRLLDLDRLRDGVGRHHVD